MLTRIIVKKKEWQFFKALDKAVRKGWFVAGEMQIDKKHDNLTIFSQKLIKKDNP